ncbi:MAG: hypothetical protein ABIM58_05075 [candidate division WOR-3 bacterium]
MKKLTLFLVWALIYGEFQNSFSQIDIPTAILPSTPFYSEFSLYAHFGLRREIKSGYEIKNYDPSKPFDFDMYGTMSLGNFFFTLKVYTLSDYAIDLIYRIMPEIGVTPAVAVGIYDITYRKYISSTGSNPPEGGYNDDNSYYWEDWKEGDYRRNLENFSLFLVFSKHFTYKIVGTFGLGRGRFVGYGSRSKYFNFDILTGGKTKHDITFGVFWGAYYIISKNFHILLDFDGRDFNVGGRYVSPLISVNFALTKLEHFLGGSPRFSPRFGFGITINPRIFRR